MQDPYGRGEPDPPQVCRWCDKKLLEGEAGCGVCGRCASLLRGAGINDQEIFAQGEGGGTLPAIAK